MAAQVFHAVGKRKTSVARVYIRNGDGQVMVNEKDHGTYFPGVFQPALKKPFELLGLKNDKYNLTINVNGGGTSSQAEACMYGIAKALTLMSDSHRPKLKRAGLLSRDDRIVERKKYGHKKARRSFQFSKR